MIVKINKILVLVLLLCFNCFVIVLTGTQIEKYETSKIEKEIKEYEKACIIVELDIKTKHLQNEKLRQDLENIRLQAFIKAYSKGEYIIETFNKGE